MIGDSDKIIASLRLSNTPHIAEDDFTDYKEDLLLNNNNLWKYLSTSKNVSGEKIIQYLTRMQSKMLRFMIEDTKKKEISMHLLYVSSKRLATYLSLIAVQDIPERLFYIVISYFNSQKESLTKIYNTALNHVISKKGALPFEK